MNVVSAQIAGSDTWCPRALAGAGLSKWALANLATAFLYCGLGWAVSQFFAVAGPGHRRDDILGVLHDLKLRVGRDVLGDAQSPICVLVLRVRARFPRLELGRKLQVVVVSASRSGTGRR